MRDPPVPNESSSILSIVTANGTDKWRGHRKFSGKLFSKVSIRDATTKQGVIAKVHAAGCDGTEHLHGFLVIHQSWRRSRSLSDGRCHGWLGSGRIDVVVNPGLLVAGSLLVVLDRLLVVGVGRWLVMLYRRCVISHLLLLLLLRMKVGLV